MKYVEQQGEKPFDWWEFLNEEEKTDGEKKEAKELSSLWVTCGCGNKDPYLSELGYRFYINIFDEDYEDAKITLRKIDYREIELIKEYEENLKTKKDE